jgi:hypothetical protein
MAARQRTIAKDPAADRPTSRPPFDPAQFAQEEESRLRDSDNPTSRTPTHRALPAASLLEDTQPPPRPTMPSGPDLQVRQVVDADAIPRLVLSPEELEWFALSPNASRVVAHVDGISPMHAVCLHANLSSADGLAIMLELAEQGIVAFG